MRKLVNKFIVGILLCVVLSAESFFGFAFAENGQEALPAIKDNELYAKSALLLDADSKRVLYQKNGYEKLPMASTTKIMTCLLALECASPEEVVTFSSYAASMPKVRLGAAQGSKFTMKDMLYSLMLESHNDTAVAIAEQIGGSVENFAEMMNERAEQIGAFNTHFVTPNGLDAEGHYTTAYDLALIAAEAVKNDRFLEIVNTRTYSFQDLTGNQHYHVDNKDAFLGMMDSAIGIKTGYTDKAGYCFVGAVREGNKTLISVVLASGWPPSKTYKWKDTLKLMRYGLAHYEYRVLFEPIPHYRQLKVKNGTVEEVDTYIEGEYSCLTADTDDVTYVYRMPEAVLAPIREGQQVGEMWLCINGEKMIAIPICAGGFVDEIDWHYSVTKIVKKLLFEI